MFRQTSVHLFYVPKIKNHLRVVLDIKIKINRPTKLNKIARLLSDVLLCMKLRIQYCI